MHTGKIDTIIIGAGVSGNYAASILAEKGATNGGTVFSRGKNFIH
jgi:flavin-dependent dehydrogenase